MILKLNLLLQRGSRLIMVRIRCQNHGINSLESYSEMKHMEQKRLRLYKFLAVLLIVSIVLVLPARSMVHLLMRQQSKVSSVQSTKQLPQKSSWIKDTYLNSRSSVSSLSMMNRQVKSSKEKPIKKKSISLLVAKLGISSFATSDSL